MLSAIGAAVAVPAAMVTVLPATAWAHGYVSSPLSRQAQCAQHVVSCGEITYEPQSVEAPKGSHSCSGGNTRFEELDDDNKGWRAQSVGRSVDFTWTNTAQHRTANWEYYIGDTRVGFIDGKNEQPGEKVTHTIDLGQFSGRQKLLAVWNIGDTENAFYSCVDLQIGGDGSAPPSATPTPSNPPTTTPAPTTPPSSSPTPTPPSSSPTTTPPTSTGGTPDARQWQAHASYRIGDTVTYNGTRYRCLQAHTVHDPNWTPDATPALWEQA
ncbi:lytic polysaccharide monooxygenase [Nocardia transvalensis]|nr:lytic polysaccharide monooxygenase [Nocardia transvalensis]